MQRKFNDYFNNVLNMFAEEEKFYCNAENVGNFMRKISNEKEIRWTSTTTAKKK